MALRRCLHRCLWLWASLCFVDWKVHVSKAPRVVVISRATSNQLWQPSFLKRINSIEDKDSRFALLQELFNSMENKIEIEKQLLLLDKEKEIFLLEREKEREILLLGEILLLEKEVEMRELKWELELLQKDFRLLTKEYLQAAALLTDRGVFERAVTYASEEQRMKGSFNCTAALDKVNKNPSAGPWSKVIFDAMDKCADKSEPKKNLTDVWNELLLPIHGDSWNGYAVRVKMPLSAASLCVISQLCQEFDFPMDIVTLQEH